MTFEPPQPATTPSVKVTVTVPQGSVAVATPVALVAVFAGHSSVRFAGTVITGGVVSFTVIVWTPMAALLHWSTAFQARLITLVAPHPAVTVSVNVTAVLPQASVAVATPVALVSVVAGHSSVRSAGTVSTGGMVSLNAVSYT